jgi:hypothetical protein
VKVKVTLAMRSTKVISGNAAWSSFGFQDEILSYVISFMLLYCRQHKQ